MFYDAKEDIGCPQEGLALFGKENYANPCKISKLDCVTFKRMNNILFLQTNIVFI